MPKRVWILGAGASKEMGYPLGWHKGISKNIKEFTYIQKPFLEWVKDGGLEVLPSLT